MGRKVKDFIKKVIGWLLRAVPLQNIIALESVPDVSDNTKALADELIRRGLNQKYKMVWLLNKPGKENYPRIPNVYYLYPKGNKVMYQLVSNLCKCMICCNDLLIPRRKDQFSMYLSYGTPMKRLRPYYTVPHSIGCLLAASEQVATLCANEFSYPIERIVPLGFPRNDALLNAKLDLTELFPEVRFSKVIVWYPTFRQHNSGAKATKTSSMPIIHDQEKAVKLNAWAKEKGVLIVLKPHFIQDLSYVKEMNLSHIKIIYDDFYDFHKISSYEFVGSCDALITDYSSIYFDYLLCDKPVAMIWEDYEEYARNPGFAEDAEPFLDGSEKIYTLEELMEFVECISKGIDKKREVRNAVCDQVNYRRDSQNASRVADYVIEKANL